MLNEKVRNFAKVICLAVVLLLLLVLFFLAGASAIETTSIKTVLSEWLVSIFIPIAATSVVATLVTFQISKKEKNQIEQLYKHKLSFKEKKITDLERLNFATNEVLVRAQNFITSQEVWKERAIKCNPEIERIVCESFAKDEADNFQKHYPCLDNFDASYMNYSTFVEALASYHNLSDEAKSFVSLNIERIREKLRDSLVDYIKYAVKRIKNSDASLHGTANDLENINIEVSWYENLPTPVKNHIPNTLITSLMLKKAHAEYQNTLLSGDVETENEAKELSIFDIFLNWLAPKISNLWNKFKNWFKKKKDGFINYCTRPFEYEYKDEILEEYEEEVSVESTSDDTSENLDCN